MGTDYKLGYFKMLHIQPDGEPDSRAVRTYGKLPTLEICLMPRDMDISQVDTSGNVYKVPAGCLIFHVIAGNEWPDTTAMIEAMKSIRHKKVKNTNKDHESLTHSPKLLENKEDKSVFWDEEED
jgi:hypothetical protein